MKFLSYATIALFLASCSVLSTVDIKRDRSAHVNFHLEMVDTDEGDELVTQMYEEENDYETDSLIAVWKAPYCENFDLIYDEKGIRWSFDLKNIDDLGKYITEYFNHEVTFKMTKKSLVIDGRDGNDNPEEDPEGYLSLMKFDFTLTFEQKVKSVDSDCNCAEKIDHHTVKLRSDMNKMSFNKKKNIVTIKLK